LWFDAHWAFNFCAKGLILFGKSDEHEEGPVDGKKK
jgi:hypothetical protein